MPLGDELPIILNEAGTRAQRQGDRDFAEIPQLAVLPEGDATIQQSDVLLVNTINRPSAANVSE